MKAADGSGREEVLDALPCGAEFPTSWSADGRSLAFMRVSPTVGVWLLPLGVESKPYEVQAGAFAASLSPDGRWIAYQIGSFTPGDMFVQPTDGSPGKWQITTDKGSWPAKRFSSSAKGATSRPSRSRPAPRSGPERRDWSIAGKGATTCGPRFTPSMRHATGNASCFSRTTSGPVRRIASTWS